MSFNIGGSAKKDNSSFNQNGNQNQVINQTTTPNNPEWVTNGASGLWTGAQGLGSANPQSYVAGQNGLQAQAGAAAGGLSGLPWNFDTSASTARNVIGSAAPQTSGVSASPYINQYMDPYLNSVVGATTNDLNANDAQTRAQQSLDLARSGAFGGSGAAITQSLTEGQLERARATTLGNLRSQGYNTALGAAQADAGRQQGANDLNAQLTGQQLDRSLAGGRQLTDLSTAYDANQRANLTAQQAAGDSQRAITQQQLTAPLDLQAWLAQQYSGLPLNLFQGQTQNGTNNTTSASSGKSSGTSFGFTAGAGSTPGK